MDFRAPVPRTRKKKEAANAEIDNFADSNPGPPKRRTKQSHGKSKEIMDDPISLFASDDEVEVDRVVWSVDTGPSYATNNGGEGSTPAYFSRWRYTPIAQEIEAGVYKPVSA